MLHSRERRGNGLYIVVNAKGSYVFGPSTALCPDGRVTSVVYIYIYLQLSKCRWLPHDIPNPREVDPNRSVRAFDLNNSFFPVYAKQGSKSDTLLTLKAVRVVQECGRNELHLYRQV